MGAERHELVLHPVDLAEALVLLGQLALARLGLGSRLAFCCQQGFSFRRLVAKTLVARGELARDATENWEKGCVEGEEGDRQDQQQTIAGVTERDVDRSVVLVELERPDRRRRAGLPDGHERLKDLDVLVPVPRHGSSHTPLRMPGEDVAHVSSIWNMRADQL